MPWTLTDPQQTYSESWAADKYRLLLYCRELVMANNEAAREAYTKYYNQKIKSKVPFELGDKVLVHFEDPPPVPAPPPQPQPQPQPQPPPPPPPPTTTTTPTATTTTTTPTTTTTTTAAT